MDNPCSTPTASSDHPTPMPPPPPTSPPSSILPQVRLRLLKEAPRGASETPSAGLKQSLTRSGSNRRYDIVLNEGWPRLRARFSQEAPVNLLPQPSPIRSFTMLSRAALDSIEASEEEGGSEGAKEAPWSSFVAPEPGYAPYLVPPLTIRKQRLVASPSEGTVAVARLENLAIEPQEGSGGATSTSPRQILHVDQLEYLGLGGGEPGSEAADSSDDDPRRSYKSVAPLNPSPPLATMPHFFETPIPAGVTRINERTLLMDGLRKVRWFLETLDPATQGTRRMLAKIWCPLLLEKQMFYYAVLCVHDDGFDPMSSKYMEGCQFTDDRDVEARNLREAMTRQDRFIARIYQGDARALNHSWTKHIWFTGDRKSMRTMWREACELIKGAFTKAAGEEDYDLDIKACDMLKEVAANCQTIGRAWGVDKVPLSELENDLSLFEPYVNPDSDSDDDSDLLSDGSDETNILATGQNTSPVVDNHSETQQFNIRAALMDFPAVPMGLLGNLSLGNNPNSRRRNA